jgi:hypothetical protein
VRDGDSGFIVSSPSGWFEALETLASSSDLRNRFAAALRDTVETECDRQLQRFLEFCSGPLKAGSPPCADPSLIEAERAQVDRYGRPRGPGGLRRIQRRIKAAVGR